MPELPETETIARDLDQAVRGRTIIRAAVTRPDVLRGATAAAFRRRVTGSAILRCWRRAKLIILALSPGDSIVVQPRFTGALLIDAGDLDERERSYSTLELFLDDGRSLHYRDIRRLGTVSLLSPSALDEHIGALGPEPLDPGFSAEHLSGVLRGSSQAVKKVLMDQRRLAGVGNIYANESLWRAGIDPSRAAGSLTPPEIAALHAGIVSVLTESIAARGTSFRDYRDASGGRGGFADLLDVYGREGSPCRRCGARLVGTHAIDGRTTVLCVRCQR